MSREIPESVEAPEWDREEPERLWDPPKRLLRSIRRYQHWREQGGPVGKLMCKRWNLSHRFWTVVTGADIPLNSRLGGGLCMPHPNGIVIHPSAIIGNNCMLFQQVTIGNNNGGVPVLGDHVDVGAGAKILGGIVLGPRAAVGANAVVVHDVPAGATVAGIPAKVIKKTP